MAVAAALNRVGGHRGRAAPLGAAGLAFNVARRLPTPNAAPHRRAGPCVRCSGRCSEQSASVVGPESRAAVLISIQSLRYLEFIGIGTRFGIGDAPEAASNGRAEERGVEAWAEEGASMALYPHIYIRENAYLPPMKTSGLDSIKSTLKNRKPVLKRKYKVSRIGIFGSFARGEQKRASDVDVLVELSEPIGLDIIALKDYLEKALGREVDLVTVKALKARMRDGILAEVVYV